MSAQQDWENFFKDRKTVANYKIGEKVTAQFAQVLINQSGITHALTDQDNPLVVLDNACGTGIISSLLHQQLDKETRNKWRLTCGDISESMLDYTRQRMTEENWTNTTLTTMDAQDVQLPSAHFTHVFTAFGESLDNGFMTVAHQSLAYMVLPKSLVALDGMYVFVSASVDVNTSSRKQSNPSARRKNCLLDMDRTYVSVLTYPAAANLSKAGWVSIIHEAIRTIPADLPFPSTRDFLAALGNGEWYSVDWIESQLQKRGFVDINVKTETKAISLFVPEFVEMSMMMFPMISKYFWAEEQREQYGDLVRPALEKYLSGRYGVDGEVLMEWTAILSTARKAV